MKKLTISKAPTGRDTNGSEVMPPYDEEEFSMHQV